MSDWAKARARVAIGSWDCKSIPDLLDRMAAALCEERASGEAALQTLRDAMQTYCDSENAAVARAEAAEKRLSDLDAAYAMLGNDLAEATTRTANAEQCIATVQAELREERVRAEAAEQRASDLDAQLINYPVAWGMRVEGLIKELRERDALIAEIVNAWDSGVREINPAWVNSGEAAVARAEAAEKRCEEIEIDRQLAIDGRLANHARAELAEKRLSDLEAALAEAVAKTANAEQCIATVQAELREARARVSEEEANVERLCDDARNGWANFKKLETALRERDALLGEMRPALEFIQNCHDGMYHHEECPHGSCADECVNGDDCTDHECECCLCSPSVRRFVVSDAGRIAAERLRLLENVSTRHNVAGDGSPGCRCHEHIALATHDKEHSRWSA